MILLGHLAKVQGLKGEFLLHDLMDDPERLPSIQGLVLAPPAADLADAGAILAGAGATLAGAAELPAGARAITLRAFRWHQDRPCVAFQEIPDRTAGEGFKGWGLWMPDALAELPEGESYRHDWIGCEVYVGPARIGEVVRLDPTPMGYDMVVVRDLRPGRTGLREIPYIKDWWTLELDRKRAHVEPPEGLLDLDRI